MRKRTKGTEEQRSVLDWMRGGKTIPPVLLRNRIAAVKRSLAARNREDQAIKKPAAEYWRQIHKPKSPLPSDPQTVKALDGLLGIHKKLAKQKLVAPKVPPDLGGILPGHIGATVPPPFDYAYTIPVADSGNPSLVGSANKATGQLSSNAVTDFTAPNRGYVYSEMGIYLQPMFGPATLRVSASPAISIEWWTNSLNAADTVISTGNSALGIWAQQGLVGPANSAVANSLTDWDEECTGQILFDFGSNPHEPLSTELQVDPSFTCILFFATQTLVQGVGWPGSLAGSVISVALPSITFELDQISVVETV
jgi:hypothetical protein